MVSPEHRRYSPGEGTARGGGGRRGRHGQRGRRPRRARLGAPPQPQRGRHSEAPGTARPAIFKYRASTAPRHRAWSARSATMPRLAPPGRRAPPGRGKHRATAAAVAPGSSTAQAIGDPVPPPLSHARKISRDHRPLAGEGLQNRDRRRVGDRHRDDDVGQPQKTASPRGRSRAPAGVDRICRGPPPALDRLDLGRVGALPRHDHRNVQRQRASASHHALAVQGLDGARREDHAPASRPSATAARPEPVLPRAFRSTPPDQLGAVRPRPQLLGAALRSSESAMTRSAARSVSRASWRRPTSVVGPRRYPSPTA